MSGPRRIAWRGAVLPALLLLGACRPPAGTAPAPVDPDARTVLTFFRAYGRRDLEGLMSCLAADATFRGTGGTLDRAQIRAFFQHTFQTYPDLRVEAGAPERVRDTLRIRVRVETRVISVQTWVFEMKNHLIHAYSLAGGAR